MSRTQPCIAALVLCLLYAPGRMPAQPQTPAPNTDRSATIGPEDTLTIQARDADEISKAWRVASSGTVDLPMIGCVQAAGKTVEQFERELTQDLKQYVRDPHVTVWVAEFRSQPVTVTGAVEHPGSFQLQGKKSLFDVLVQAGGPREAGSTVTVTRRAERGRIPLRGSRVDSNGMYSVAELNLSEVINGQSAAANLQIEPYDVIVVSALQQRRLVHILGEVTKPGAVELVTQDSVSLLKVLSMAGGLTHQASPGNTLITHASADGRRTENAKVNIKQILSGHAKDLELSAGDIVIVPASQLKSYLQTASVSALNAGVFLLGRL
jgi:polysaccharide biosynthesis/export protein